MDIERIVVRLIADATQYNYVMDLAIKSVRMMAVGVGQVLAGFGQVVKTGITAPFILAFGAIKGGFQAAFGVLKNLNPFAITREILALGNAFGDLPRRISRVIPSLIRGFRGVVGYIQTFWTMFQTYALQGLGLLVQGAYQFGKALVASLLNGRVASRLFAQAFTTLLAGFRAISLPMSWFTYLGTALSRFGELVRRTFSYVFRDVWKAASDISGRVGRIFSALGTGLVTMFTSVGRVISGVFSGIASAANGVVSIIKGALTGSVLTVLAVLTGVTIAIGAMAVEGIKLAAEYENTAIAFEVMTGSATEAKGILEQLNQLAVNTPFKAPELLAAAKQIKAFGIETKQVMPVLATLGEVASGTGTPLERIALAFGQVQVAGRLMGPELRQFTDAGIPLIEELAKVMKKPVTAIKGLTEAGLVGRNLVNEAFNSMTQEGGIYFGMMERQSQTTMGRWTAFTETLQITARDVGLSFFKNFGATEILSDFTKQLGGVSAGASKLDGFFRQLRGAFDALRAAGYAVGVALGENIGKAIGSLSGMNVSWENVEETAVAAIEAIIMGIGAMIEQIKYAGREMADKFIIPLAKVMQAMRPKDGEPIPDKAREQGNLGGLGGVLPMNLFGIGVNPLGAAGLAAQNQVKAAMREAMGQIMPVAEANQFLTDTANAGDSLTQLAQALKNVTAEGNDATKIRDNFRKEYERLKSLRGQKDDSVYDKMNQVVAGLGDAVKRFEKLTMRIQSALTASPAAQKLASQTIEDMVKEGGGIFDQFKTTVELLDEAQDKQFKRGVAFDMFGIPYPKDMLLDQKQADFGLLKDYHRLVQDIGGDSGESNPKAIRKGEAEAQDIINASNQAKTNIQEEVLANLIKANLIQEEQKELHKQELEALRALEKKGMFVKAKNAP